MSADLDIYDDQHEEKSLNYPQDLIAPRKHLKVVASGQSETPSTISPFMGEANDEIFDEAKENKDEYHLTLQSNSEIGGCARGKGKIVRGRGGKFCTDRNSDSSNSTNCFENENSFEASSNTDYYQSTDPTLIQTSCIEQEEVEIILNNLLDFFYRNNNEVACNRASLTTNKEELKFFNPCPETMKKYQEQMSLKLQAGYGEARYTIGLGENQDLLGLTKEEMLSSLKNICLLASGLLADVLVLHFENESHGKIAHLLVRSTSNDESTPDIRILLLGDIQSGKSTLIGVLTSKQLDDGNGLSRTLVHSHKHEIISGETSSLNIHMVAVENNGNIIALKNSDEMVWRKSVESGAKVLTSFDVDKKKALSTISSIHPDYAILVISAIQGITKTSEEQMRLAITMKTSLIITLTHTDLVSENFLFTLRNNIEGSIRKFSEDHYVLFVESEEDNLILSRTIKQRVVIPVFKLSNVNGKNFNLFKSFLTLLPVNNVLYENASIKTPAEFHTHKVFNKEKQIILAGTVRKGCLKKHQIMMFGPDFEGKFRYAEAQSIRCKNVSVKHAYAGQTCTIEIKLGKFSQEKLDTIKNSLKHRVLLLDPKLKPVVCREFQVEISVPHEEKEVVLYENYEPVVISESIRQVCTIDLDSPVLKQEEGLKTFKKQNHNSFTFKKLLNTKSRLLETDQKNQNKNKKSVVIQPGQTRTITFRFKYTAEYLAEGQKVVINDNCVNCVGTIRKLVYDTLRT